jgi:hypothetical protein
MPCNVGVNASQCSDKDSRVSSVNCRCGSVTELEGARALAYADKHLREVKVDAATWEVEYVCPTSGQRWLMDYPQSGAHGGGSPRLRAVPSTSGVPS